MDSIQALNDFWNSFQLSAYDENTVSDSAVLPYITYSVSMAAFDEPVTMVASVWYKSRSWLDVTRKAMEINRAIGRGGKLVPFDGGYLWIKRGVPFAQRMSDEDDTIRRIYLNLEVEYFTTE